MSQGKTHYRKVFKSDHLGVADLEDLLESGSNLIFTITHVKQEWGTKVAGKKGDFNMAYFKEGIKPWPLNAGNCLIMQGFANGSPCVEDWGDTPVQLYIDKSAKFGGRVTGGVRIHPSRPKQRQELTPNMQKPWNNAISAYKRDGNLNRVLERMDISHQNQNLIIQQAGQ